jgi:hypothetical protein
LAGYPEDHLCCQLRPDVDADILQLRTPRWRKPDSNC